jgi:DNA-binding NarL/FixJ family response regulator
MRPSRLIYVENDPALLGVMSNVLRSQPMLELLLVSSDPLEVLGSDRIERADVALLDLALGRDTLTGMDLGMALRNRNPNIGIVIHSQHPMKNVSKQVPENQRMGWSYLAKSGTLKPEELTDILRSTARGMSHDGMRSDDTDLDDGSALLADLTARQRVIMGLASLGMSAPEIGEHIDLSSESVRKDLSKAYQRLVPDAGTGSDVRTKAVLAYLRLIDDVEQRDS